ncbi:hypothetical protein QE152_g30141 [Popillia japonica]|uniref:Transposase n=1 Tax=Popillia japonica TaxID=7064 RepID=A0AAW1JEU7_POPJA
MVGNWSESAMQRTIDAVSRGDSGWLKASKLRRVQKKNKDVKGNKKGLGRYRTTFSEDLETQIVDHIKTFRLTSVWIDPDRIAQTGLRSDREKWWAHCECADVSMKCKTFICDVCR